MTPGSLKSHGGNLKPALSINGIKNPPKQASTWRGILYLTAILDNSSIGSIDPIEKHGAEPAIFYWKSFFFIILLTSFKKLQFYHASIWINIRF